MARKITEKKPLSGNRRSHACNATKHMQKPNLQKVKLDKDIDSTGLVTIDATLTNIDYKSYIENLPGKKLRPAA